MKGTDGYPDVPFVWRAETDGQAMNFDVSSVDGATGTVSLVKADGAYAIRIEKLNDRGAIRLVSRNPVSVGRGTRVRAFAAVTVSAEGYDGCRGSVRVGPKSAAGAVNVYPQFEGHPTAWKKLDRLPSTHPDGIAAKAAYYEPSTEGEALHTMVFVEGRRFVSVWKDWRIERVADVVAARAAVRGKAVGPQDCTGDMIELAAFEERIAKDCEHVAKVVSSNGVSRLTVDGKLAVPILHKGAVYSGRVPNRPGYFSRGIYRPSKEDPLRFGGRHMADSGVVLQVAPISLSGTPWREGAWTTNGFDAALAVEPLRLAMRTAPDALWVVTIKVDPPREYAAAYPEEIWTDREGHPLYGNQVHMFGSEKAEGRWPWISMHSLRWRGDVKRHLAATVSELKRTGLAKRIVGVHFQGFHDGQFTAGYPDFSEPARLACRAAGFSDLKRYEKLAPMLIMDDLARHLRKSFDKDIVVFRWCMGAFCRWFCSSYDLGAFVDSREIDIIVPQADYMTRSPTCTLPSHELAASFHLHGKLLVREHDLRTFGYWDPFETEGRDAWLSRARDPHEWATVNRRAAGQMLAQRSGFWYYDMQGGWFAPKAVADDIADVVRLADRLMREPIVEWQPSVAFAIDEDDLMENINMDMKMLPQNATVSDFGKALVASGVPFDTYLARDLDERPELARSYRKVYRFTRKTDLLTGAEINRQVREAGGYVPVEPERVEVDMNGNFLSVHCLVPGRTDFLLPFPCRVINLKTRLEEPVCGNVLPLDMTAGETCWFSLRR